MASGHDTIFALSSGSLPSGVAVIRISGPRAFEVCEGLSGALPAPRQTSLRTIRRRNGEFLDQALVLVFKGPHSFTGEDSVELHLHGSRAIVAALHRELIDQWHCRHAEAGEFSRRAFENGKLDLAQIEGLADLLQAETEMQRRLAVDESFGRQSRQYQSWRERLLYARAMIEAEMDFSDEDDVPGSVSQRIFSDLPVLVGEMETMLASSGAGEIIRDGLKVVIAGPPNAGKSSLLNALAKRDIAIVTDVAGTTRDVLHCDINLDGYLVRLFDTAGIRETDELVEQIGISRARGKLEEADLVLWLDEIGSDTRAEAATERPVLHVGTKADVHGARADARYDVTVAARAENGLDELYIRLSREIEARTAGLNELVPSRARHEGHIRDAISHLQSAMTWGIARQEMAAESLRLASDALGRITGRIDTEEILGVIFSSFCIGK